MPARSMASRLSITVCFLVLIKTSGGKDLTLADLFRSLSKGGDGNVKIVIGDGILIDNPSDESASRDTEISIRTSEACRLVPKHRKCEEGDRKYFFNIYKHRCDKWVGRCPSSNINAYTSLQECRYNCEGGRLPNITLSSAETCRMVPRAVTCTPSSMQYYFDVYEHRCQRLASNVCPIGWNSFLTKRDCQLRCEGIDEPVLTIKNYEVCRIIPKFVPCRLHGATYFYHLSSGKCTAWLFGICPTGGNAFRTLADCQAVCQGQTTIAEDRITVSTADKTETTRENPTTTTSAPTTAVYLSDERRAWGNAGSVCVGTSKSESCSGGHWVFSVDSGVCVLSNGSRCDARNQFTTAEACETVCTDVLKLARVNCSLEKHSGRCKHKTKVRRWNYVESSNRCLSFSFTECPGNVNNFHSKNACEEACPGNGFHGCLLPPTTAGACPRNDTVLGYYYYDPFQGLCLKADNLCPGSVNSFASMTECRTQCKGIYHPNSKKMNLDLDIDVMDADTATAVTESTNEVMEDKYDVMGDNYDVDMKTEEEQVVEIKLQDSNKKQNFRGGNSYFIGK